MSIMNITVNINWRGHMRQVMLTIWQDFIKCPYNIIFTNKIHEITTLVNYGSSANDGVRAGL